MMNATKTTETFTPDTSGDAALARKVRAREMRARRRLEVATRAGESYLVQILTGLTTTWLVNCRN